VISVDPGDKVGNLKRGGSLERDKPIPRPEYPVGPSSIQLSGWIDGEAREGSEREGVHTATGEKSLKRRKPMRASTFDKP
jgi:hypothetical protein